MSTIPLNQKFHSIKGTEDTLERKSSQLNALSEVYTMQDMVNTVEANIDSGTDSSAQVAQNVTDIATNTAAIAALPPVPTHEWYYHGHVDNNNANVIRAMGIGLTAASDRIYGYSRIVIPVACEIVSISLRTEFQAGVYTMGIHETSSLTDNTSINGSTFLPTMIASITGDLNSSDQKLRKDTKSVTGAIFAAGDSLTFSWTSVVAPGQTPFVVTFRAV